MKHEMAYKFIHTYDQIQIGENRGWKYPLWLVAQDPFANVETDREGHILHLGAPRFTAKWYVGEEPLNPTDTLHGITYNHPDLDISLCEIVFLDEDEDMSDLTQWLQEACFVVAHYRGDLGAAEPFLE